MAITYHAGRRIQATSTDVAEVYRGETPVTVGSDTVITFLQDGKFTPTSSFDIEYLVVAGGGQGGQSNAGGGGAGGYLANNSKSHGVTAQDYTITVGGKGTSAGSISQRGTAGENSSIVPTSGTSFISIGGGGGGSEQANPETGGNGGSGGGGNGYAGQQNASNGLGGTGTSGQGNAGGNGSSGGGATWRGGGGGGSASAGANGSVSGNGGNGTQNDISGTNTYYSAGGGGGCYTGTAGSGGTGGGGNGSQTGAGGHATTYGSGGGGSDNGGGTNPGGNGGDGIVIIKFATSGNTYNTITGKPTNVQEGSRLEETDTRKMYNYSDPMTKEFNFSSSTGWVSGNSTYFNIGSNKLNVKSDTDNIQTNMTYDLLANDSITVGTSWVMTFTLDIASPYAVNTNSGNQHRCYIGLASATTVGEPANIDEVAFTICPRSDINAHESFNNNNTTAQYVGTGVTVTSGTKYIKLIRDGNTSFKTYIYNNADYSDTPTITEASNNLSNITGTKYIKVSQFVQGYSGTLNFTIDDLKFYNGVTQTTNYWQEIGS